MISADLERSGLFRPLDPRAFLQTASVSMDALPRFADWRVLNAPALVYGRIVAADDGRLKVEFRLWDVFAEQQLAGLAYFTAPANWRRIAHIIADAIYKRITGEDGYFDTRIVYVAESGPQTKRVKRLAIMDQDGANHRFLTDGSDAGADAALLAVAAGDHLSRPSPAACRACSSATSTPTGRKRSATSPA